MDNKEIDKLSAAYNNVPDKQVINELSWFNPYNSVTSAAKRWASGRGGLGSQFASKWMPGGEELHGQSELEDETNEVWKQFRRQILSQDKNPKGANILSWFKNILGIDATVIPALRDGIVPNERYYNDNDLRAIFKQALSEARQQQMVGNQEYDRKSVYATNHKLVLRTILDMDPDTTCDLIGNLLGRAATDDTGGAPDEEADKEADEKVEDEVGRAARNDITKNPEKWKAAFESVGAVEANIADAGNMTADELEDLQELIDKIPPHVRFEMEERYAEEIGPEIRKEIAIAKGEEPVEDTLEAEAPDELEGEPDETA